MILKMADIKLQESLEERRKFPLEDRLRKHIVGQEGAIATVAGGMRLGLYYRMGMSLCLCSH